MKVVLRQTDPKLGRVGEIIDVTDAFARNFLLPQGRADVATPTAVSRAAQRHQQEQGRISKQQQRWSTDQQRLNGATLQLSARANDRGGLFAAVKGADVVAALQRDFSIDPVGLTCSPGTWKKTGTYPVTLTWPTGQSAAVTIRIVAA